jgi:hypothetical protein
MLTDPEGEAAHWKEGDKKVWEGYLSIKKGSISSSESRLRYLFHQHAENQAFGICAAA